MNEEENAAELSFGDEFDFNVLKQDNSLFCLTNDEMYSLLSKQLAHMQQSGFSTTE